MNISKEIEIKHKKVKRLLESSNLDGLLLAKQSNFKWFTCGGKNDVVRSSDVSLVYLFITIDKRYLIATSSDACRIMDEELKNLDFEMVLYNWYNQSFDNVIKKLGKKSIGADFYGNQLKYMDAEVTAVRSELTQFEVERFKQLYQDYNSILTEYCFNIKPGRTEIEAAAEIEYRCRSNNINLPVLMVGSDERVFSYRHPCATGKKVNNYMLIATVAERGGLCANISRSIYFGKIPKELKLKQDTVNYVQANYQYFSKPGNTLGTIFEKGKKAYAENGYPDEWKNHLQGGISGYSPLEFMALEYSKIKVRENNIISWNPTVKGAKSEDPHLVARNGAIQLPIDSRWPVKEYGVNKDRIFIRPLILEL
ncbi:MAG: M24 family metallopeptidase [Candidatus Humimicrobiaceae bacterium]